MVIKIFLFLFLFTYFSVFSIEINEIVYEYNIYKKENVLNKENFKLNLDTYRIEVKKAKEIKELFESDEFRFKYGNLFFVQTLNYNEMGICFSRIYFYNSNKLKDVSIIDMYEFSKTKKMYYIIYEQTYLGLEKVEKIIEKKIKPHYLYRSELKIPNDILIDNIKIEDLKYDTETLLNEQKKKLELEVYSSVEIICDEIYTKISNKFNKYKLPSLKKLKNKELNMEITTLNKVLEYLQTKNKKILEKINYIELNELSNKNSIYSKNPILYNLSLGFKMKFYEETFNGEVPKEKIEEEIRDLAKRNTILKTIDKICKIKKEYQENKIREIYKDKFD
ncbi:MAG: hypothetical protein ACRC2N_02760 [Aeromonas sp.]